jgi:hypothetical protein
MMRALKTSIQKTKNGHLITEPERCVEDERAVPDLEPSGADGEAYQTEKADETCDPEW